MRWYRVFFTSSVRFAGQRTFLRIREENRNENQKEGILC